MARGDDMLLYLLAGAAGVAIIFAGSKMYESSDFATRERAKPYLPAIARAEKTHGIPTGLLYRVLEQESRFRDDIITGKTASPAGALGIAQFMPATAAEVGINPLDPAQAIDGAAKYLARLKNATGDWQKALASYNWGIGNVQKAVKANGAGWLAAAPVETRNYVTQVTGSVPV